MGMVFGIIISLTLIIALRGSFEHIQYSREKQLPLLQSFKATLANRSFITFVISNLFVQFTFTIILATIPFFAKYILDQGAQGTAAILAAAFIPAIPMLYFWKKLTIKFGAKKCFMATMIVLAVSLFPLFFVQSFAATLINSAFIGIGLAGFILTVDLIISDVIDEDETITGTRREGMYFGANAFITRFAIGLEAMAMGICFVLTNYNPYVFTQTREFILGLRFLIAGLPIIALIFGFMAMWFYPLSGPRLKKMRAKILKMHIKKGIS